MLQTICTKYGYTIEETFTASLGSQFVARVKDKTGRQFVLKGKRSDMPASSGEQTALRAWAGKGAVEIIAEPEQDIMVLDYIPGSLVRDLPDHGQSLAHDIGRLAKTLHIPAPQGLRTLGQHLEEDWESFMKDSPHLTNHAKAIADESRQRLSNSPRKVLLHGDLWASNIIADKNKLTAIDPYGLVGDPAYDISFFPIVAEIPGRRRLLKQVVQGYGEPIPLLAESWTWTCLLNYAWLSLRGKPLHGLDEVTARIKHCANATEFLNA